MGSFSSKEKEGEKERSRHGGKAKKREGRKIGDESIFINDRSNVFKLTSSFCFSLKAKILSNLNTHTHTHTLKAEKKIVFSHTNLIYLLTLWHDPCVRASAV